MHLEDLLRLQRELQDHIRRSAGRPLVSELDTQGQGDYIAEDVLGATDELHEALDHVGWKSWAKEKGIIDRRAYLAEVVDVLFFWMNLVNVAGASADEVEKIYVEKHARNMARYANGPDGYSMVSGKCPVCRDDHGDIRARGGLVTADTGRCYKCAPVAYAGSWVTPPDVAGVLRQHGWEL